MRSSLSSGVLKLGGAAHRFRRLGAAEAAYNMATRIDSGNIVGIRRLAEARVRHGDIAGARAAYTSAIDFVDLPVKAEVQLRRRRAKLFERDGMWNEAIADYEAAFELMPAKHDLLPLIASAQERLGRLDEAARTWRRAHVHTYTSGLIAQRLAETYAKLGAWWESIDAYNDALSGQSDDLALRMAAARVARKGWSTPFTYRAGRYQETSDPQRERFFDSAVETLLALIADSPSSAKARFELGRLFESRGLFVEAAEHYRLALDELPLIDSPWTYRSGLEWQFRYDYVLARLGRQPVDARHDRVLIPAIDGPYEVDLHGNFAARVTNSGLLIEGFVLPGHGRDVRVCLDGERVKTLRADERSWLAGFGWTILHPVLDEFPSVVSITLSTGFGSLRSVDDITQLDFVNPHGKDGIRELFDNGHTINKKGRLTAPDSGPVDRTHEWFESYRVAREIFSEVLGRDLFVLYGTLLGCYRDGGVILGDDDFDVGFTCEETSPREIRAEITQVMIALVDAGLDTRIAIDGRPFHLGVSGVGIDVNPVWFNDGAAWSFARHDIERSDIEPCVAMGVSGTEVLIPRDTEKVLRENYGKNWDVPESGFRYYRSETDLKTLRKIRLKPSEVEMLSCACDEIKASNPDAGRFRGYADPTHPDFD